MLFPREQKEIAVWPCTPADTLTMLKSNYTACLIRGTRSEEETVAGVQFSNVPLLDGAYWTALLLSAGCCLMYSVISEPVSR